MIIIMIIEIDQCVQISLLQLIEFLSRQLINGKDILFVVKTSLFAILCASNYLYRWHI